MFESGLDLVGCQRVDAGGRQLDGQGQSVQGATDRTELRGVVAGEVEAGIDGLRAPDEQLDGRRGGGVAVAGQRERRHRVPALTVEVQRGPAGREDRGVGAPLQEFSEERHGREQVLEVVEHEQQPPVADVAGDGVEGRTLGGFRDGQGAQDGREQEGAVGDRCQPCEHHAVGIGRRGALGGGDRQAGLADPPRAGQRQQARPAQQADDVTELAVAADQIGRRCGQGAGRARGDRLRGRRHPVKFGFLEEDRLLQAVQLGRRFQSELSVEDAAELLVGGQGVRLAAAAVHREHQLGAQRLPQGMLGDERLELSDQRRVLPERQAGLDAALDGGEASFLKARCGELGEGLGRELAQRRSPPEREPAAPGSSVRRSSET